MGIYRLRQCAPVVADTAYIADSAYVIGNVVLHEHTSVWFGAVVRGDNGRIVIGPRSNVQDGAVLHVKPGGELRLGSNVTVGHQAMLHGCTIGDGSLIGIGSIVLDGVAIPEHCLVGAGAVVTPGLAIAPGSLLLGSPAKVVRPLSDAEIERLRANAGSYVADASSYLRDFERLDVQGLEMALAREAAWAVREHVRAAMNSEFGQLDTKPGAITA